MGQNELMKEQTNKQTNKQTRRTLTASKCIAIVSKSCSQSSCHMARASQHRSTNSFRFNKDDFSAANTSAETEVKSSIYQNSSPAVPCPALPCSFVLHFCQQTLFLYSQTSLRKVTCCFDASSIIYQSERTFRVKLAADRISVIT